MILDETAANGRLIAAGRMFAGLDQSDLASAAGVSPATISNVERGNEARPDTIKAISRALKDCGVSILLDKKNGMAFASIHFEEPDDDD